MRHPIRTGRATRLKTAVVMALCLALFLPVPAQAAGPKLLGGGSQWVAIALEQWSRDVASMYGLSINYQAIGSAAGRQAFIIDQMDFVATEIPFEPHEVSQLKAKGKNFQYIPDVAGGTALMYNLKDKAGNRIWNLQLSPTTIAKIFTGGITYWDDPAIVKDYGKPLPHNPITPVLRSDGSGTSAKLADYLDFVAPTIFRPWMKKNGLKLPIQYWAPIGRSVSQKSSDGMANFIANDISGANSIGYLEAGYALERRMPVAGVLNKAGKYALPSSTNVAKALEHATLNADRTQNLEAVYVAPEPTAYPLASYSYMVTQTNGFDPAKGAVLGKWLIYVACAAQQKSATLGYSPIPKNLVELMFDGIRRIPGAPEPPAATGSACPNPTMTGKGYGGGGFGDFTDPSKDGTAGAGLVEHGDPGPDGGSDGPDGGGGTTTLPDGTVVGPDGTVGGAGGGGLFGTDGAIDLSQVTTMSPEELLARQELGLGAVGSAESSTRLPLWLSAVGLLALVSIPVARRFVRLRKRRGGGIAAGADATVTPLHPHGTTATTAASGPARSGTGGQR